MKETYHIFKNGRLEQNEKTLRVQTENDNHHIPVKNIDSIMAHGQLDYNTRLLTFLNEHNIELHVYGWNGQYVGSHIPRKQNPDGQTIVDQVEAYKSKEKRVSISKEIVKSSIHNMLQNAIYYKNKGRNIEKQIKEIRKINPETATDINELLGKEASARELYYDTFNNILLSDYFTHQTREYNPPTTPLNSIISYMNSLMYAQTTTAIRKTSLDPTISYLHEPSSRRFSLSLDIADIFKPVITDRILFRLINKNQITKSSFQDNTNGYTLTEDAKKLIVTELEDTLDVTIEHPQLKRNVSYKYLLRHDVYKLQKHIQTNEKYKPLKRWW